MRKQDISRDKLFGAYCFLVLVNEIRNEVILS